MTEIEDLKQSMQEIRHALWGNPADARSRKSAVIPTMERMNAFMDFACYAWKFAAGIIGLLIAALGLLHSMGVV